MDPLKFPLANKGVNSAILSQELTKLVTDYKISYLEAAVVFCERNNIEIETAASILSSDAKLKSILLSDGEALNIIKKTAKLPV